MVAGTDATAVDFRRFTLSILWVNNDCGYLPMFLVAKAAGSTGPQID